jgi:hypothetical protein
MKIMDPKDVPTKKAQQTGVYVGPGGDHRYYKAGADIALDYRFDREIDTRGYRPPPPRLPKSTTKAAT